MSSTSVAADDVFYIISHMANTVNAVDWAVKQGANALEMDLQYTMSGEPKEFNHGPLCDCTCRCPPPFTWLCSWNIRSACYPLRQDFSQPCIAKSSLDELLGHVASKSEIALVMIDSKLEDSYDLETAGSRLIQTLDNLLFQQGYGGNVLLNVYSSSHFSFLMSALTKANSVSPNANKIYVSLDDGSFSTLYPTVPMLQTLGTQNLVFGSGISSCIPLPNEEETLELAAINKARGAISMGYTWTVDSPRTIENHLDYVQGIITNYPSRVRDVIQRTGRKLATQANIIPPISTTDLVMDSAPYDCDCEFRNRGCVIKSSAHAKLACKCELSLNALCSGKVVLCRDSQDPKCLEPDVSLDSCLQGGGNCGGYTS